MGQPERGGIHAGSKVVCLGWERDPRSTATRADTTVKVVAASCASNLPKRLTRTTMKRTATTPIAWTKPPRVAAKSMISSGTPKCLNFRGPVFMTSALRSPFAWRWLICFQEETNAVALWVARWMHCGFLRSRSNEFRSEGILDFMNKTICQLATLGPLHVYVNMMLN